RRKASRTDDEDEDEDRPRRRSRSDDEDDDRPRRKKGAAKGRRRSGGAALLIGGAAALLLPLVGGAFGVYFIWFADINRGSGNEAPLAFRPGGPEALFGLDYPAVLADPTLGPQFEKAIREQGHSGDLFGNVKKETGLDFKELFAQTLVASDFETLNNAGMMA